MTEIAAFSVAAALAAIVLVWRAVKEKSALAGRVSALEKENAALEKDKAVLESRVAIMMEDVAKAEERHRSSVEEIRRMNEQYLADSDARHRNIAWV